MEKNITKRNYFTAIANFAETGEFAFLNEEEEKVIIDLESLRNFATNELELLDKRAAKNKERASKKKEADDELMLRIKAILPVEEDQYMTIQEILNTLEDPEVSAAKVTARLSKLAKVGSVEKQKVSVKNEEGKKIRDVQGYRLCDTVCDPEAELTNENEIE